MKFELEPQDFPTSSTSADREQVGTALVSDAYSTDSAVNSNSDNLSMRDRSAQRETKEICFF